MSRTDLLDALIEEQARRCCYGTRDGDGRTCDCKYDPFPHATGGAWRSSEVTGCPEFRAVIRFLKAEAERAKADRAKQVFG